MATAEATYSKPETAREALALWDKGELVWTVEMGGMGPGYEQCIHVMAFEIIRELLKREPIDWTIADRGKDDADAKREWRAFTDAVEAAVQPRIRGIGASGAQWGAAQSVAYRTLRIGWAKALSELPDDRLLMVSKAWPKVDESPASAAVDPYVADTGTPSTRA